MWRIPSKSSLFLLTAGAGCTVTALAISDDSPTTFSHSSGKISVGFNGLVRSSRAVFTIASNVIDYKYCLHGLPEASDEYKRILSEVHLRSANRILKLCETNRGFYVKAGQFAAALRQLPAEYSSTLSSLQDQAVPCQFKAIKEALTQSLKKELTDIFLSFDEQPIAAASIAQVHRAVLKNHEKVAVKVQYPGLDQLVKIDLTTMAFLSKFVTWIFPEYRFGWIVSEFKEAITMELDFVQEAKNSERTANNFRSNKQVKVPKVFWEFTTGQVLTMQFCAGHKVARTLVQVFASMIFIHGFVHRDLHPGNILVAPHGQKGFTLVLLDHGTYKELDEGFRLDYCQLWEALILLDSNRVQELGERFGIGKFTKFLPLIFIGRMINNNNSKSTLGKEMSMEEKKAVKEDLKSLKMEDISSFMESLPPDFLTILRTDGLLRSNLSKLGAPRHYRLQTYVKCAIFGLSSRTNPDHNSVFVNAFFSRLKSNFRYLRLRIT
ncbi:hypothetical protein V2J09_015168 [Rumex salicifolius]